MHLAQNSYPISAFKFIYNFLIVPTVIFNFTINFPHLTHFNDHNFHFKMFI